MVIIKCVAIMISGSILCHPLLFPQIKKEDYNCISSYLLIHILCNDQDLFIYIKHIYLSLNSKLHHPTLE